MFRSIIVVSLATYALGFMPRAIHRSTAFNAMPSSADDKVWYALGVNVARQVGGELKGVLSPEEIKVSFIMTSVDQLIPCTNLLIIYCDAYDMI
jgi:hypothetical protein